MLALLEESLVWREPLLEAIRKRRIAWRSNTAVFYDIEGIAVAKVFNSFPSQLYALREFLALMRVGLIADPRLKMPEPITLINLGAWEELHNQGLELQVQSIKHLSSYDIHAVIMEKIEGTPLCELDTTSKSQYRNSLADLADALVEYGVRKRDLKEEEIFCLPNSSKVVFVDGNFMHWGNSENLREFYKRVIR